MLSDEGTDDERDEHVAMRIVYATYDESNRTTTLACSHKGKKEHLVVRLRLYGSDSKFLHYQTRRNRWQLPWEMLVVSTNEWHSSWSKASDARQDPSKSRHRLRSGSALSYSVESLYTSMLFFEHPHCAMDEWVRMHRPEKYRILVVDKKKPLITHSAHQSMPTTTKYLMM
jgi:hypothetical protein